MNGVALSLPLWSQTVVAVLLLVGAAMALIGSWALVRLDGLFLRLHGTSLASSLGLACLLLASVLNAALSGQARFHEVLILLFLFVTTPVSAHFMALAALHLNPALRPRPPP